ncbi:hypothetical protein ACQKWADRAFT_114684 [Trichoderma austrokoningii]
MDNQASTDSQLSHGSSISLEDHNGPAPRLSRSDLYTGHQIQRDASYPAGLDFISLDFPTTYSIDEIPPGVGPSGPDEPLLSSRRLEQYLSDELRNERIALGLQPLGVNRATVQHFLPEIIQSVDNDASQVEATVGTAETEEGVCWGSFTTMTSSTSDGSFGLVRACNNNNDDDSIAEPTNPGPLRTTTSSDQNAAPSPATLGKSDVAPIKPQRSLTSNEDHLIAQDTAERDLELEALVSNHCRTSSRRRRGGYRAENQPRVKKTIRFNRRSEKQQKEKTK